MAHPGTLPVINREAVKSVLRVGIALGGKLVDYTEFDRKNYFYPDLPKGYQLSQYEYPLVSGGELRGVQITRVHLEEDTASSLHDEATGTTTVDYNRAGVPLMELVTEPVVYSSEEAGAFARELQLLLRTLDVSEANMEKGEMRVEANVSVSKGEQLGTKVEIKNLNSFRAMERAVEYEIKRQIAALEKGEQVMQETRGWDEGKQATFPQRTKEGSADYRYFPDPDLPSLKLSEVGEFLTLKNSMPELPWQRRDRYTKRGVKKEDADLYVREPVLAKFVENVLQLLEGNTKLVQLASNYIANDLVSIIREAENRDSGYKADIGISPRNFVVLTRMIDEGKLSSRSAKDILLVCVEGDQNPEKVANEKGLLQLQDVKALENVIDNVFQQNEKVLVDLRSGKVAALQFLVGQAMKATKGAANPAMLRSIIEARIRGEK